MQQQQLRKRQKTMRQMAFDYLRYLTDLERLAELEQQTNHNINN